MEGFPAFGAVPAQSVAQQWHPARGDTFLTGFIGILTHCPGPPRLFERRCKLWGLSFGGKWGILGRKLGIFWENGNFVGKNGNFQAKLGILGGCGGAVGILGEILWENRKF